MYSNCRVLAAASAFSSGELSNDPGLIHQRHVARRQFRHARGDQVHDRGDLAGLEAAAGIELQHHRCGRLARIAQEHRGLRQRQMHARALHALHLDDGARQFRLEHRLIARAFHHGAGAERGFLLNHFDAHRIALRQPLARQADARLLHLGFRHRHRAGGIELEFDAGRRQRIHDLAALALRELAVEHRVVLSLRPQDQPDGGGDGRGDAGEQARLA